MQRFEHRFVAMGGPCCFRVDSNDKSTTSAAITAAEAEVRRLESKYSRYLRDSLTSQINRCAGEESPVAIDDETAGLLNYAQTLWQESNGLFDLTSGVLRRAWDFKSRCLPQRREIDALLPLVGWQRVQRSETHVRLPVREMELDFGGCVKEYACDSAARILRIKGVGHALVDLAGDIAVVGGQASNEPWQVGIRHPAQNNNSIAHISLSSGGLASSGNYERFMEVDGHRYGHIINPKTGWPVRGLLSVSVVAEQCLVAGSSATIAMLMPPGDALDWLGELGLPWLAVDADLKTWGTAR